MSEEDKEVFFDIDDDDIEGFKAKLQDEYSILPNINLESEERNQFIPTPTGQIKYYNKIKYEKFVIAMIVLVVAVIAVGIVSSQYISYSITDVNAKADKKNSQLESKEGSYSKELEGLYEEFDNILSNNYNYEKYIRELKILEDFKTKFNNEEWYNPYSDSTPEFYDKTVDDIDRYEERFKSEISKDLKKSIENLIPSGQIFDKDGNVIPENTTKEFLYKVGFNKLDNDDATGSDVVMNRMRVLDGYYNNVVNNQTTYEIYSIEDFATVAAIYQDIRIKLESIYSVALNKETTEEATKKADEEFEKKKTELRESIEDEIVKRTTEEVTSKLEDKYESEISKLESENKELKQENSLLNSNLEDITAKYNSLKNKSKS